MDHYAKNERNIMNLRQEMVDDIRSIFFDRGYQVGETANDITVEYDRVLVTKNGNPYHTDNISTDELLSFVRKAEHIIYK